MEVELNLKLVVTLELTIGILESIRNLSKSLGNFCYKVKSLPNQLTRFTIN